jgi:uncharacterized protein
MNFVTQIAAAEKSAAGRVAAHDWDAIGAELNGYGCAVLPKLLTVSECRSIAVYPQEEHFRSQIHMARHGFGKGEYRYFKYPLCPHRSANCGPRSMHGSCPTPMPGTSA